MRTLLLSILLLAAGPAAAQDLAVASPPRIAEAPDDSLDVRVTRAQELAWAGDAPAAAGRLRGVLAEAPGHRRARLILAGIVTWTGGADEAVALLRPLAQAGDLGALAPYAHALYASGDAPAALRAYRVALRAAPDDAGLWLAAGEAERWSGRWTVGRDRIRHALALGLPPSEIPRAWTLLRDLGQEHAPTAGAELTFTTDSNGFETVRVPLQSSTHLAGPWRLALSNERYAVSGLRPPSDSGAVARATRLFGAISLRAVATATLRPTLSLGVGVWGVGQDDGAVRAGAELSASRRWTAGAYRSLTARLRSAPGTGVPGAGALRIAEASVEGYADLRPWLGAYATATARSFSNDNARLSGAAGARAQVLGSPTEGVLSGALATGLSYEDTRTVYADARPYWTPNALVTAAATVELGVRPVPAFAVTGLAGLGHQRGPGVRSTSAQWGVRTEWTSSRYRVGVAWERTGSSAYSAQQLRAVVAASL